MIFMVLASRILGPLSDADDDKPICTISTSGRFEVLHGFAFGNVGQNCVKRRVLQNLQFLRTKARWMLIQSELKASIKKKMVDISKVLTVCNIIAGIVIIFLGIWKIISILSFGNIVVGCAITYVFRRSVYRGCVICVY